MKLDVRLIAILDPSTLGTDALAAARAAAAGGATALQVRMKNSPAAEILRWTERLVEALAVPVYVNDRADIAWAAGAAGVHLGADDLPVARVRAAAPRPVLIGISVGTESEAQAVRDAAPDYWSIGSVYPTPSKADAGAPIGTDGLRRLAGRAPAGVPVIGIGGITAENVGEVIAAGAVGVAVIGAIFGASDPEQAARRLRDAVDAGGARTRRA